MGNEPSLQLKQGVGKTPRSLNISPVPYIVNTRTDSSPRSNSPSPRYNDRARRSPVSRELVERGPGGNTTQPVANGKPRNGGSGKVLQSQGLSHQQVYQGPEQTDEARHCCLQETRPPAEVVNNIATTGNSCSNSELSVSATLGDSATLLAAENAMARLKPQPHGTELQIKMNELSSDISSQGNDITNTGSGDTFTNAWRMGNWPHWKNIPQPPSHPSLRVDSNDMRRLSSQSYKSNTDNFNTGEFSEPHTRECGSGFQSGFSARTEKSFDTEVFSVNSEISSSSATLDSKLCVACETNQRALFDESSITSDKSISLDRPIVDMSCLGGIAESSHGFSGSCTSQSGGFKSTNNTILKNDIMLSCESPLFGPSSGPGSSSRGTINSHHGEDTMSFRAAATSLDHVSKDDIFRDDARGADQIVDCADVIDDQDSPHVSGYFSFSPRFSSMTSSLEENEAKKPRIVFGGPEPTSYISHMFDSHGFHPTTSLVPNFNGYSGTFCPPNHVNSDEVTALRVFKHVACAPEHRQEALPELFDSYNSIDPMSASSGFISPVVNPGSPDPFFHNDISPQKPTPLKNLDQDGSKEKAPSNKPTDDQTNHRLTLLHRNQNNRPLLSSGSSSSSQELLTSGDHSAVSKRELSPIQNGGQGGNGRLRLADDPEEDLSSTDDDEISEQEDVGVFSRPQKLQGRKADAMKSPGQQLQIQFPPQEPKKEKRIYFEEPANDMLSIFDSPHGQKRYYAAYLCCAPQDLEKFGIPFHAMIEDWGFRIFLAPRDLVLSGPNFENMSRALEERCNGKIIVILSNSYATSGECQFLTAFARVLDPDAKRRNIIPVQIDKNLNEFPNVLKGLCIIRYNHDYKCGWLKRKLVDAIAA